MYTLKRFIVGWGVVFMAALPVAVTAADLPRFSSLVGLWSVEKDGADQVYAVDGVKWKQGTLSPNAEVSAKLLFGENAPVFLKKIAEYKTFPLSIYREVKDFGNGTITVSFMALGGKEDQAAGIAFNIRENGEYLAIRANALENNLILFSFARGNRSHVLDIDNVPTAPRQWHTLKVVIQGDRVEGHLDGKEYLEYTLKEKVSGRIGLWSKADSSVMFKGFSIEEKK